MPVKAPKADEWKGPWGSILPEPHSAHTLTIVLEDGGMYSYPVRNLVRWVWKDEKPETLEILAGKDRITICGSGLRRLAEALNDGQLAIVCVEAGESGPAAAKVRIQSIRIEV